jgi:enoyl-CoA hydratase/carnithine racemase
MALIRIEQRQETTIVCFARPPANAFNLEFAAEFHACLDELAATVPAGGIVVTGDGRTFSGGVDFKAVPGYTPEQRARMIGHINAAMTTLYGLPMLGRWV